MAGGTCVTVPSCPYRRMEAWGLVRDSQSGRGSDTQLYLLSLDELFEVEVNLKGDLENSKTGRDRCLSNHNMCIKSSPCTRY